MGTEPAVEHARLAAEGGGADRPRRDGERHPDLQDLPHAGCVCTRQHAATLSRLHIPSLSDGRCDCAQKMEQNVRLHGLTVKDVASMFQAMDADGSGGLDYEEFKNGLKAMDLVFGPKQLDALIEALDQDGTTSHPNWPPKPRPQVWSCTCLNRACWLNIQFHTLLVVLIPS